MNTISCCFNYNNSDAKEYTQEINLLQDLANEVNDGTEEETTPRTLVMSSVVRDVRFHSSLKPSVATHRQHSDTQPNRMGLKGASVSATAAPASTATRRVRSEAETWSIEERPRVRERGV